MDLTLELNWTLSDGRILPRTKLMENRVRLANCIIMHNGLILFNLPAHMLFSYLIDIDFLNQLEFWCGTHQIIFNSSCLI